MRAEKPSISQESLSRRLLFIQEKAPAILQTSSGIKTQTSGTMTAIQFTSLTAKAKLCIQILTAISLLLIFPFVSASPSFNVTLNSPAEVQAENEFIVSVDALNYDSSLTYDVKIYVNESTTSDRNQSEIYDSSKSSWQTSFNYLIGVFPGNNQFKIKSHYIGKTIICFQLRQTGTSYDSKNKVCNAIIVDEPEENQSNSGGDNSDNDNNNSDSNLQEQSHLNSTTENLSDTNSSLHSTISYYAQSLRPSSSTQTLQNIDNSKIVLSPKKAAGTDIFVTSQEKLRLYLIFGFTILCVIIILFLSFRFL